MSSTTFERLDEALQSAPKHGLNAKALILQAALDAADDTDDEAQPSADKGTPHAQRERQALDSEVMCSAQMHCLQVLEVQF